ncbi:MAG TPA: glycosyltransferase family 9 protein, partial [Xanthobacteraceae bacterium]|nr:glycosyltransferase family 9 protein [Xanthobacteraceae bacterium]
MQRIDLPERPRILVIALRRLGDVLLTTPLIRSLRGAFPDAIIDALVFAGTEGVLQGNPDINGTVVMPARPSALQSLGLARQLWRSYDLAISTQGGDRPTFFCWAAGRVRIGLLDGGKLTTGLKRRTLHRAIFAQRGQHRVLEMLRLADLAGVDSLAEVICPGSEKNPEISMERPYAVIHAAPKFQYKRWTHEGWRQLGLELNRRGFAIALTGGPAIEDRQYLDEVWDG